MTRLYVDNNVWNHLADQQMQSGRSQLATAVRRHEDLLVLGSFPLLEEITATSHSNRTKATVMRDLAFSLVGRQWIREIVERIDLEIPQPGRIPDELLFLPRSDRRKVEKMTKKAREVSEISNQVHELTTRFKEDEERIRGVVAERLGAAPGSAEMRAGMSAWFREVDVDEWCRETMSPKHRASLEERHVKAGLDTVPSLWLFVRFKMARITLCVGENRRIDASDLNDARHYACGAYFDVLVTEDRRLRETCALINETPFAVWNVEQLLEFAQAGEQGGTND